MKNLSMRHVLHAILLWLLAVGFVPTALADVVDINNADSEALQTISGIGPVKAQAIIDYRKANGPFKSTEDLKNVKGIGDATYNKMKSSVSVSSEMTKTMSSSSTSSEAETAGKKEDKTSE